MDREHKARRICAGLLLLYGLVMVYLLFLQRMPAENRAYNLQPFHTIGQQLRLLRGGAFVRFAFINLAGNVIMFVPMGLMAAVWQKQRHFGRYLLTAAAIIFVVEGLQFLTRLGAADVDDWLLNMLGAVIGFEVWRTIAGFLRLKE